MPQQFVIPQFIDVESKIFGPITMRQFIIVLVALFLEFIYFKLSDLSLFIILSAINLPAAGALAFVKVNGIPVPVFLLNFIQSSKKPKLRVWDKSLSDMEIKQYLNKPTSIEEIKVVAKIPLASSRLAELSLIVDTGGIYKGESSLEVERKA